MRNRPIQKIGSSYFIKLIPQDLKDLKWKLGEEVNIEECNLAKNKK